MDTDPTETAEKEDPAIETVDPDSTGPTETAEKEDPASETVDPDSTGPTETSEKEDPESETIDPESETLDSTTPSTTTTVEAALNVICVIITPVLQALTNCQVICADNYAQCGGRGPHQTYQLFVQKRRGTAAQPVRQGVGWKGPSCWQGQQDLLWGTIGKTFAISSLVVEAGL